MRLDRLKIPAYRNLRGFEINFDESQPTTVLLGQNGTGKSNLLEALVEIFRELELGGVPDFPYELDYLCRDQAIQIKADPQRKSGGLNIRVGGKRITKKDFLEGIDTYLPSYVFAYYSGWSNRLEKHFDRPTRRHYERILRSPDREMPLRRLFFCRKHYSQLVLLAFFLAEPAATRELLEKYLGIKQFESALFVLKTPWWRGGGAPSQAQQAEGDPRFWHARGAFKGFLDRLWKCALAPIRNTEAIESDVRRKGESTERLYLFVKNQDELAALKGAGDDTKTLFGYLESLFLCDLIDEVRVTVQRTDGHRIKFVQMSEGEQQLLTVLGLLLFTQDDEALYLLDEPDTHLNPVWSYDLLDLLKKNIRTEKGHLIVASHDPIMIGSLRKEQVRVLQRVDDRIVASPPEYDPIGVGVEGLLKSKLYGMRSTLAPEVLVKLDRHYKLLGLDARSEEEQQELMQLAVDLNELGISRTHPNPYFERFANAMARRRSSKPKRVLSNEEIDEQAALADEVIEEILAEENESEVGGMP